MITRLFIVGFAVVFALSNGPSTTAAESTWDLPGGGNWLDPASWTDGVPGAGDTAIFGMLPNQAAINLDGPASVGGLVIANQSPLTFMGGPLSFDTLDEANDASLRLTESGSRVVVDADMLLLSDLLLSGAEGSRFTLNGSLRSGNASLTKSGAGLVQLAGDNSAWSGEVIVTEGTLVVAHADALGSARTGTMLNGGSVRIDHETRERFSFRSGSIFTNQPVELITPLELLAGGTATVSGSFQILGGAVGTGDVTLVASGNRSLLVSDAELMHEGRLFIATDDPRAAPVVLDSDNSYTGATRITSATAEVRSLQALGTLDVGTTVIDGTIRIHPGIQESITLENSRLEFLNLADTFNGDVVLRSGQISDTAASSIIIRRPLVLDGGDNRIAPLRGVIRLEGGVVGSGELVLAPDRDDNVAVEVASPLQHTGALAIGNGRVRFQHPLAFEGPLKVFEGGRLVIETEQQFESVFTSGSVGRCCEAFGIIEVASSGSLDVASIRLRNGAVNVASGGELHAQSIHLQSATISGNIVADGTIDFVGFARPRTVSDLATETPIRLYGGELKIEDTVGGNQATRAPFSIHRVSEAVIELDSFTDLKSDINLNNGTGFAFGGALRSHRSGDPFTTTISGDIYLGADGAHIGGAAFLRLEGNIRGGDLFLGTRIETPELAFVGDGQQYTGRTFIRSGAITLVENGRMEYTSGVELYRHGRLYIDNGVADGAESDRVANDLSIRMHGGEISTWPVEWGVNTVERIGHVNLVQGHSFLRGTSFFGRGDLEAHADLVVGEIAREPGALLTVGFEDGRAGFSNRFINEAGQGASSLRIENRPATANGFLPAWIVSPGPGFTIYGPDGVSTFAGPFQSIATADATKIVQPAGGESLSNDLTVHGLQMNEHHGPLDLNGHVLTIESGGLFGFPKLLNGQIQPGRFAGGEIIIAGEFDMAADIIDNGRPTSVLYSGDGDIRGNNQYTGDTYFVGKPGDHVEVKSANGLPVGGNVFVNMDVSLAVRDGHHFEFDTVTISDAFLSSQCCDNVNTVSANIIQIESGGTAFPIVGDARVNKTTVGIATMYMDNPDFTGVIDVHAGILRAGIHAFGQGTVNVHPGGRLVLLPVSREVPTVSDVSITLNGGSLYPTDDPRSEQLYLIGDIDVIDDSDIYMIDGFATELDTSSGFEMTGDIRVAAAKTLSVWGGPSGGELRLTGSGKITLEPGAVLSGNASIRADLEITNGSAISPGRGPDQISLTSMTWGPDGRYIWEMNHAQGDAGAPAGAGWDQVFVEGQLTIDATDAEPFVIEFVGRDNGGVDSEIIGLAMNTTQRWAIVRADLVAEFDAAKFEVDASQLARFHQLSPDARFWTEFHDGVVFVAAETVGDGCAVGDTVPCNGLVDIDDLNSVRNNLGNGDGSDVSGIPGDTVPFDGRINADDVNRIRNNFGRRVPAAVPEPSTFTLLSATGLFALLALYRSRAMPHFISGVSGRIE